MLFTAPFCGWSEDTKLGEEKHEYRCCDGDDEAKGACVVGGESGLGVCMITGERVDFVFAQYFDGLFGE